MDDQKLHIKLLESILHNHGFTNVQSSQDPRQGMILFEKVKPDLLILDLNMPHLDGFQIMEKLQDRRSSEFLPILICTNELGIEGRVKAFERGANDYINIPYESVEIITRIKNLIEMRHLHLELSDQKDILEQKVKDRTRELKETQHDIIRRLARAAEYRDNETGMHIARMSHYSVALGKASGLSDGQCELLHHASPLHDVGKIGIPDNILLKPGKLTNQEYEIMKTHTTIGAQLLSESSSPLMQMAEIIALTHQEKWDGSGYPKGLKGEEIPLVGRLCGLCDCFDALTSSRPYKEAWPFDKAIEEIKKQKAKQFDPRIVEIFLQILKQIHSIYCQYRDE